MSDHDFPEVASSLLAADEELASSETVHKYADYRDVWAAFKTVTPIETWSLVAATILNLVTY
jgi:hypothetical protein